MSIIFVLHVKLIPGQVACQTAISHLYGRAVTIFELLKKKRSMTVIPNLIILSLPLSFSRKKGCHQNNIVSQNSKRELFSSTQDLKCKIELVIFTSECLAFITFHAVINHYDNGSKMDLHPPIIAP